jgi:hypothetical protein
LKASHSRFEGHELSPGKVLHSFSEYWQLARVAQKSVDTNMSRVRGILAFEKELLLGE